MSFLRSILSLFRGKPQTFNGDEYTDWLHKTEESANESVQQMRANALEAELLRDLVRREMKRQ